MVQQISLKNEIDEKVLECLCKAEGVFKRTFPMIPIYYDLTGRVAGQHCRRDGRNYFRVNWTLFVQNKEHYIEQTVPHEVAHYITGVVFPFAKSHGREWKSVMERVFGRPSDRCHSYDVSATKRKRYGYDWNCGCKVHHLTVQKHNKILYMIGCSYVDVGKLIQLPMFCTICKSHTWTYQGSRLA